jgi:hypothetical protein
MTFVAAFPTKLALLTRRPPIAYTETFSEISKTIEAPKKNVFKPFSELYFAYDVLRKNFPRSFTEITAIHELFKKYSVKRFYEPVNVVEILKKVTLKLFSEPVFIREVFRKNFPKTFAEALKAYEIARRVIIKRAFDALYGEHIPYFYRGKTFLEVLRLSDRFTEFSLKKLLEIAKAQEVFAKFPIKRFYDLPKALEIPRRNISKRFVEQYFIQERITESLLKHVVDLVLASDLISKYVITDLIDTNRLLDVLAKHTGKIIEFETSSVDYHKKYIQYSKAISDLFTTTDAYKLLPMKKLLEIAKAQEVFTRTITVTRIFIEGALAEFIQSKDVSAHKKDVAESVDFIKKLVITVVYDLALTYDVMYKTFIKYLRDFWYDAGLMAKSPLICEYDLSYSVEIVTKVLYTLMQKTVRRVYFLPPEYKVWWDIILASDHNTKVLICKAFLDAFKRVSDKLLGVRVPISDTCKVSDSVEVITT